MHLARLVIELHFPEQSHVLGVRHVDDVFVSLPIAADHVAAIGQPVGPGYDDREQQRDGGCGGARPRAPPGRASSALPFPPRARGMIYHTA